MALFKVNTGLREKEVVNLRWLWEVPVPELDTSVFVVPRAFVKNGLDRFVVLNRIAKSVIDDCRGGQPEFVFTRRGKPITRIYNSGWKAARRRASKRYASEFGRSCPKGFQSIRVHDLKHTYGHRLRAAGVGFEDRKETPSAPRQVARLKERITTLKQEMRRLRGLKSRMEATPDGQVSLVDPDARSMASQGKGTGIVGYNVQTAVDTKNHLIVTHEVTNVGSDRQQLKKMAEAAREALGTEKLTAIADRGYYNGEQIKACDDAGIVPLIPKSFTSNSRADGRYDKSDFVYVSRRDAYRCPAGEYAIRRFISIEHGMAIYKYWSSACPRCALRAKCTTSEYRRIGRWGHEQVLMAVETRAFLAMDAVLSCWLSRAIRG
jgi:hypothetical protein